MAKTQKELEEQLSKIYDEVIQSGRTHDEALEKVAKQCKELTTEKPDLSKGEYADKYNIKNSGLSYNDYFSALQSVLPKWQKLAEKSISPTGENSSKLITIVSNIILQKIKNKIVIDPAIGTGSLLLNIQAEKIFGQDINERLTTFASVLLDLNNQNNEIKCNDSINKIVTLDELNGISVTFTSKNNGDSKEHINEDNIWSNKGLFVFDPPMSIKYEKPSSWNNKTNEIFGKFPDKYIMSELAFLVNFLIFAKEDSYCICKMPSSVLTSRQNDLDYLRKYLIEKSLICSIKDEDGFIILVCKKYKEKITDKPLYSLIFNEETEEIILKNIINLESISDNKYVKSIERNALLKDDTAGNVINLPISSIITKEYKPPIFYYNQIIQLEENIIYKVKNIGDKLIEHDLISLSKNDNKKLNKLLEINDEMTVLDVNELESVPDEENPNIEDETNSFDKGFTHWFENSGEQTALTNSLRYLYPSMENIEGIVDKYETNLYLTRNVSCRDVKTFFNNIRILFENKKIEKEIIKFENKYKNRTILKITLEPKEEKNEINYNYLALINPIVYFSNDMKKSYYLLSKKQKQLYIALCKHWFNNKNVQNQELFKDYSYAYLTRTFKTFEILGLVIYVENQYEQMVNKYDEYRPFHPLIDNTEIEEDEQ